MKDQFIEFDRIMRETPGFIKEMGIELLELREGYAKGRVIIEDKHLNPMGTVHGGLIFGLTDTIGGRAAMTTGYFVVTLNSSISYLNPAPSTTAYIEAEANVVRDGRTTAVYDVIVRTAEGVDVSKATVTFYKVKEISE